MPGHSLHDQRSLHFSVTQFLDARLLILVIALLPMTACIFACFTAGVADPPCYGWIQYLGCQHSFAVAY